MKRRSFLKGLLAVPFAVKAVAKEPEAPDTMRVTGSTITDLGNIEITTEDYAMDGMRYATALEDIEKGQWGEVSFGRGIDPNKKLVYKRWGK